MPDDDKGRVIGKVTNVSADKLVVELHRGNDNFTVVGFDDMHYVARLGSFVLVPVRADYVVCEVTGLWEKDPQSSRPNQSEVEMDKAASAKFLALTPLGMIWSNEPVKFEFGVSVFPPLYADALYARDEDLDRVFQIVDPSDTVNQQDRYGTQHTGTIPVSLEVGTSVVFKGYPVKVRIDEFFGGHVAILGNTGSGKSCTVATILQSLFERPEKFAARGASFVLFDVNREYQLAFSKLPDKIKRLYLKADTGGADKGALIEDLEPISEGESVSRFHLPHWLMSVEEWELLLRASERTQQPVLRMALGLTSLFSDDAKDDLKNVKNYILATSIIAILQNESGNPTKADRIRSLLYFFFTDEICLGVVGDNLTIDFGKIENVTELLKKMKQYMKKKVSIPGYSHKPFPFENLDAALDLALYYEEAHGNRQIRDFCAQLVTRLKSVSEREEFSFLRCDPLLRKETPDAFIERLIGISREGNGPSKSWQITIVDLHDATDESVEIATAVISRMVFEKLRRATPRNKYPVHMILEEAHRYIAQKPSRYAIDASRIFERIAKEGRKYGAFLLVASQRPSELSRTVLSQCSNFVVHRIQNPDDLSHIRQMTPFISESVLKRLPSLPKQHALIFGNAVNIPTTFKVRNVNPAPNSGDTKICEIWFRPDGF